MRVKRQVLQSIQSRKEPIVYLHTSSSKISEERLRPTQTPDDTASRAHSERHINQRHDSLTKSDAWVENYANRNMNHTMIKREQKVEGKVRYVDARAELE